MSYNKNFLVTGNHNDYPTIMFSNYCTINNNTVRDFKCIS